MTVVGLEWRTHPGNLALDGCPNNGGSRIFPDWTVPNENPNPPDLRRQVDLVATISPPKQGCHVYFRVWDVDDPFESLHVQCEPGNSPAGCIRNLHMIDADASGPDNRPPPGEQPVSLTGTTNASGQATVTFTTSMQPGNNYRAGASVVDSAMQATTQTEADANLPPFFVQFTDMLTVWRKLHVATDTMARPHFEQNTWRMHWISPRGGHTATQVIVDVHDTIFPDNETKEQQFRPGLIELDNLDETAIVSRGRIVHYLTWENTAPSQPDEVTMNLPDCGNNESGLACLHGVGEGYARLSDDELQSDGTFTGRTWGCDDAFTAGSALSGPDLNALHDRYAPAYIEVGGSAEIANLGGISTFLRNTDFSGLVGGVALWNQCVSVRGLPVSTSDFWTVTVVSAWQAEVDQDCDPDAEFGQWPGITKGISTHKESILGDTPTVSSMGFQYTGICAVFKAVSGEAALPTDSEGYTVVHEVGHTFGLDHVDVGAMCAVGDCQRDPFAAISLRALREYIQP